MNPETQAPERLSRRLRPPAAPLATQYRTANATATSLRNGNVTMTALSHAFVRNWPLWPVLALAVLVQATLMSSTFLYGDDAEYALTAQNLSHNWRNLANPDIEGFGPTAFVEQPPLMMYLFSMGTWVAGSVEGGIVLVSFLLALLTVVAVYFIGVRVRDRTLGAWAAGVLAIMPLHVLLTRRAFFEGGVTFFMALTMLFFLVWLERRNAGWAVATGLATAGATLSHGSGALILVPLAIGLGATLVRDLSRKTAPRGLLATGFLRHVGFMALPLVAGMLLWIGLLWHLHAVRDLLVHHGWIPGAAPATSLEPAHGLGWYFNAPNVGLYAHLGMFLAFLCLAGVVLLLLGARHRPCGVLGALVVLAWPIAIVVSLAFSPGGQWYRILPLAPAIALLAAEPLASTTAKLRDILAKDPRRTRRRIEALAVIGTLGMSFMLGYAATSSAYGQAVDGARWYGDGTKEAALFIEERDADAGQVSTTLGRYPLHLYNGNPTYHWYVDHAFVNEQIEEGKVRYLVADTYLPLDHERDWFADLVERYDGQRVRQFPETSPRVTVYELHPENVEEPPAA